MKRNAAKKLLKTKAKTRENKIDTEDTEIFLASLYNRHMRYTEAEEILRPILAKNKRDIEGNYELGYSLLNSARTLVTLVMRLCTRRV